MEANFSGERARPACRRGRLARAIRTALGGTPSAAPETGALPGPERYRLGDQLLRAARSTTANIAEGYGRFHFADNVKFISNSRGSCGEVLDHLITGNDEDLITREHLDKGRELVGHAVKILNGYMSYLRRAGEKS